MIEPQTVTVGSETYVIQPWPAMKAWRMQTTLGRVFKKCLSKLGAALGSGTGKVSLDSEINLEKLGEAFAELFDTLNESEAERIVLLLMTGVLLNGKPIDKAMFDIHFIGKLGDVYKLIVKVLEVNYGSFLEKSSIGSLLGQGK